jgi:hypothetical protein
MPELEMNSVPDALRARLVHWSTREEFELVLRICRHRVAEAVAEHATLLMSHADEILKKGLEFPGLELAAKKAAQWTLVHDTLRSLQAEFANGDKSISSGLRLDF